MARGLLNWSIMELARNAGVGHSTIKRIEKVNGVLPEAQVSTLKAIHRAFTRTGVVRFEGTTGVLYIPPRSEVPE
ncbi:MAG: transcriptional regulator [Porticoccaceae bacterium]|nr:transcriptional regulator [Porticoccaceae bacterium]